MTAKNHHLIAIVTAGTKLDAASRLAKEASIDIARSGLFPVEVREGLRKIAAEIDACLKHIIKEIPSS